MTSDKAPYAVRIEKGIPIPNKKPRGRCGGVKPKYPWHDMEVGDSFLMPSNTPASVAHSAVRKASQAERQFITHYVERGRYRVWRIE